jgi:hypothetical protein
MNLILFIVTIAISFIVVRVGAVAFQLTGLEWSVAKFQSLSCFSGTGFTTREAELIVTSPRRRRIATVLMVLGNAGLVTIIATLANSMRPDAMLSTITLPVIHRAMPGYLVPVVNIVVMVLAILVIYRIFVKSPVTHRFTRWVKSHLVKRDIVKPVSFEELFVMSGGVGVTQVEISARSVLAGQRIRETDLSRHNVIVLAVGREGEMLAPPPADTVLAGGDHLVCFGKLDTIKAEINQAAQGGKDSV